MQKQQTIMSTLQKVMLDDVPLIPVTEQADWEDIDQAVRRAGHRRRPPMHSRWQVTLSRTGASSFCTCMKMITAGQRNGPITACRAIKERLNGPMRASGPSPTAA